MNKKKGGRQKAYRIKNKRRFLGFIGLLLFLILLTIVVCHSLLSREERVSPSGRGESLAGGRKEEVTAEESAPLEGEGASSAASAEGGQSVFLPRQASVLAVGDIMHHGRQDAYAEALSKGSGKEADYRGEFVYFKGLGQAADLTIGNWESATNDEKEASGYPLFNTPSAALAACQDAGFDVLTTANNHGLDMGMKGIRTTIQAIRDRGMESVGSRTPEEDKDLILDRNGIRIAVLAYAQDYNGIEASLNEQEKADYLKLLDPEKIHADILRLKEAGADFIIIYPHWGVEYQTEPTDQQKSLARQMAEWGAGAIIGNHPHVVEPYESYQTGDGRTVPIVYACGNFISSQRLESMDNRATEESVAVEMLLESQEGGGARLKKIAFHPLWVRRRSTDQGWSYQTLPTEYALSSPRFESVKGEAFSLPPIQPGLTAAERERVKKAQDHVLSLMDEKRGEEKK